MKTKLDVPQAIVMAAAVVFVAVILMKDPSKITELGVPTMAMLMSALRGRVVDSAE